MGVQWCEGHDRQVSSNAEYIGEEEKYEDYRLKLWDVCESQQNDFRYIGLVFHC